MINVYFLRHGKNYLSTLGEEEVIALDHPDGLIPGEKVRVGKNADGFQDQIELTHIITSPLPRAVETANLFQKGATIEQVVDKRLKERELKASHQGFTVAQWNALQISSYKQPFDSLDNLESCAAHLERVTGFWNQLQKEILGGLIPDGSNVLVVSHGGTMEHVLRIIYQGKIEVISKVFATCDHGHFHHLRGIVLQDELIWNFHGLNVPLGPH